MALWAGSLIFSFCIFSLRQGTVPDSKKFVTGPSVVTVFVVCVCVCVCVCMCTRAELLVNQWRGQAIYYGRTFKAGNVYSFLKLYPVQVTYII